MPVSPAFVPAILDFWFGTSDPGAQVQARMGDWFHGTPELDAEVRRRFGDAYQEAVVGRAEGMLATPGGRLAYIILIDQFSRNIHRASPDAFSADGRSLRASIDGIAAGVDRGFGLHQRAFFYLPLEHAEDRDLQARSVALFTALREDAPPALKPQAQVYLDFAVRHRELVERFGRFPHRNATLGRTTTIEEFAWLRKPGAGF